jgi:hypothetical protein
VTIESAEEFVRLRTSDVREEYERASSESAAESVWMDVIERHPDMRAWVAHNKTVPLSVLRTLASDEDARVRWMVASKRKLDHALFELLSRDSDDGVRARVAANSKAPREVLVALASDEAERVRDAARRRLGSA